MCHETGTRRDDTEQPTDARSARGVRILYETKTPPILKLGRVVAAFLEEFTMHSVALQMSERFGW